MNLVTHQVKPVWLIRVNDVKVSAYICSKGMEVRLWRRVDDLVVELLLPDEPPCLQRNLVTVAASRGARRICLTAVL